MNKTAYIHEACIKANPEILTECEQCGGRGYEIVAAHHGDCDGTCAHCPVPEQERCYQCGGAGEYPGRPIRLADVLLAMTPDRQPISVDGNGVVTSYKAAADGITPVWDKQSSWNLCADDLTQQSTECIDFLYELLK